jgi:oligopeptidase B
MPLTRLVLPLLMTAATTLPGFAQTAAPAAPPVAQRIPFTVKSPNGDRIDEYHWLRDDDPKAKRPEVIAYLEAENAYTGRALAPLATLQEQLVKEMRGRIREDDSTPPVYDNGHWYWREFKAGDEYPRHLRRRGGPAAPDASAPVEVLLDLPAMAAGKAFFRVATYAVSPDGRMLAWTEDTVGRNMHVLRFKNLATGEVLPEQVSGVLDNLVWAADSRTLFYIRQDPVTLQSGPVWRHRVGTPASADVMVYDEPDKTQFTSLRASASRAFVLIDIGGFDTSETRAVPAAQPTATPRVVLRRRPQVRHTADHWAGRWTIQTNEGAVNFKLVSAPEAAPDDRRRWRTVVPHREQGALEGFVLLAGGIAVQERIEADARVRLIKGFSGGAGVSVGPGPGNTVRLGDNRDPRAAHLRYGVTSLVLPPSTFDVELATGRSLLRKTREVPGFDAAAYATTRLWAPSRDGKARIPVTIAWRRDKVASEPKPAGTAPVMIEGYGAYGYSYDATFSSNRLSLLDRGFVLAIAHVRGGADLGQGWYEAGRLANKQNTFDDFVDATDALVATGWADKARVFASGGSAGGLLMGAVANQAGARYRGIVLDVPFVDVVTTMLDETIPLTTQEWTQWGDPREKAAYERMLAYSPYDNLRAQPYPAMLVTTGLWDSQVQYYEPAKYVARLRARKTDDNVLLLHTNMTAGHGGASGRFQALQERAREYAFVLSLAGVDGAPAMAK